MARSEIKNTDKNITHLNAFVGGSAVDFKNGIANSFYSSQAMDFRQKLSQMSVLPGFRQASGNLQDLITAMVQDPNGVRYAVGNQGYLYRISTSGVISQFGKLGSNGAAGIAYNQQSDQLYIPDQQTVSLYGQLTNGTPQLRLKNFGASASISNGTTYIPDPVNSEYDGAAGTARNNLSSLANQGITLSNYASLVTNTLTNTYVVATTTISETPTTSCFFVPDIEPFYSVAVYFTTIGSGNITLTMHDSLNNNLGAVTIANASMNVGWNNFVFASPGIRAIPSLVGSLTTTGNNVTYHFHVTSSVSNDTTAIATINASAVSGANFVLFAHRLVQTHNGWHPTTIFGQFLCVGNGNYLSTYPFTNDSNAPNATSGTHGLGWDRHALSLDYGYEVCGLSVSTQYLVISAEKRSNNSSRSYQDGMLYFWDGTNTNFNFKIDIPMGAPYSVYTFNNVTYFYCAGSLFAWGGGQQVIKVRYMAYQNTDYLGTVDSTIVNPNMMDVRYNLLMLGYPSSTTNSNINYGIYSWGAVELTYPNSFGYSYAPSIGMQNDTPTNDLQLGMIKNFVDTMYQSWQYTDSNDVTHYGLDILDNTSTAAATFNWQSLIWDGGVRYKLKRSLRYRINFLPLPAGATLTANYTPDRGTTISADPVTGNSYSANTGDTAITVEINNVRFKELQWGFSGTNAASVTTPVTITGVTMEIDPGSAEAVAFRNDPKG